MRLLLLILLIPVLTACPADEVPITYALEGTWLGELSVSEGIKKEQAC